MVTPDPAPAVTSDPAILGGEPCIAGTRVPAAAVKRCRADGWSVERIMREYPGLSRAQVEAALAWQPPQPDPAAAARLVAEELGEECRFDIAPDGHACWAAPAPSIAWGTVAWLMPHPAAALVAALSAKSEQREELERLREERDSARREAFAAAQANVEALKADYEYLRRVADEQRKAELERLRARVAELEQYEGAWRLAVAREAGGSAQGPAGEAEAVRVIR